MVHIRFTSLVLSLLFVTHALREFYVHAHQGWEMKGNGFEVTSREDLLSTNYHKELPSMIGMDSNYLRKLGFGGRKMVGHHLPSRKEVKKDELDEEAAEPKKNTISGSSVTHFDVDCRFEDSRRCNSNYKPKVGGFVALGDDYKGPRQHPPKNN